jgi:glycosyltransferase involved in cell wall biosynthesis
VTPKVSIIVCCYNMARELPRTIRSLSPLMQRGVQASDYEIIVVDNGSTAQFDEHECRQWGADLRVLRIAPDSASPSPVRAINEGIAQARGRLIGVMIDGARLASPGLVRFAIMADALAERTVILTLGFHLGSRVQMESVLQGYDREQEDRLLEQSGWTEDGYRLFDVSVFAGSSAGGWFRPIGESNAIFMRKPLWDELGGFDDRFQTLGGGYVNLDTLARAVALPEVTVVTLLGEGTFHQVHGGVATNATHNVHDAFQAEYMNIRGHPIKAPVYRTLYVGSVPVNARASIGASVKMHDPAQGAAFHLARAKASRMLGETEAAASAYRTALTFDADLVDVHVGLSTLRMPGDDYLIWLARLQEALSPETYLEIGVSTGQSLALARPPTRAIGVDPQPKINVPFAAETHIFRETSDEFFAKGQLASLLSERPLSLAFIDGEHVFAQSLKDFINVEAFCGQRSAIMIHDTIPLDEVTQRPNRQRKFYTGDVWKTVLCLKHYRPDLDIFTIAAPWSGLTIVTGLNPASRILVDRYREAIERFDAMPYADVENCLEDALSIVANDWPTVEARLKISHIIPATAHAAGVAPAPLGNDA